LSGPSVPGSVVPSGSVVSSALTSASAAMPASNPLVYFVAGSIRDIIVTTLGIPEHLINRKKGGDIRVAYAKYLAIVDTLEKLSQLSAKGTWKHNNTNDDVIEVFVSKSVYFRNHAKVFPLLVHYPAMEQWLENADGASADSVVWGNEKHSFDGLNKILTAHEKRSAAKGK